MERRGFSLKRTCGGEAVALKRQRVAECEGLSSLRSSASSLKRQRPLDFAEEALKRARFHGSSSEARAGVAGEEEDFDSAFPRCILNDFQDDPQRVAVEVGEEAEEGEEVEDGGKKNILPEGPKTDTSAQSPCVALVPYGQLSPLLPFQESSNRARVDLRALTQSLRGHGSADPLALLSEASEKLSTFRRAAGMLDTRGPTLLSEMPELVEQSPDLAVEGQEETTLEADEAVDASPGDEDSLVRTMSVD